MMMNKKKHTHNRDPSNRTITRQSKYVLHHLCTQQIQSTMAIRYFWFSVCGIFTVSLFLCLSLSVFCAPYISRSNCCGRVPCEKKRVKNAIIKSALANLFHLMYRRQCVSVADCTLPQIMRNLSSGKNHDIFSFFFYQTLSRREYGKRHNRARNAKRIKKMA